MAQRTYRYRGHEIKPKLDFGSGKGFLIKRKWVKKGWVVVKDFCNVMPGACWFQSLREARNGIDVLIKVKGNAEAFWEIMQPFEHEPGVPYRRGLNVGGGSATITKGKHWAKIENGKVVAVGHRGNPPNVWA